LIYIGGFKQNLVSDDLQNVVLALEDFPQVLTYHQQRFEVLIVVWGKFSSFSVSNLPSPAQ
jgi:hypothetical protein